MLAEPNRVLELHVFIHCTLAGCRKPTYTLSLNARNNYLKAAFKFSRLLASFSKRIVYHVAV